MHNSCSLRIRTIFNSEHIRASEEAERSFKLRAPEAWGQRLSSLEVPLSLGLAYLSPLPSPESSKLFLFFLVYSLPVTSKPTNPEIRAGFLALPAAGEQGLGPQRKGRGPQRSSGPKARAEGGMTESRRLQGLEEMG